MRRGIPLRRVVLGVYVLAVLIFLIVPVLIVIPMSFSDARFLTFPPPGFSLRWYHAFFSSHAWLAAASTSLQVAVMATAIATPIGVAAAYAIENTDHWSMRYVRLLLMLPPVQGLGRKG